MRGKVLRTVVRCLPRSSSSWRVSVWIWARSLSICASSFSRFSRSYSSCASNSRMTLYVPKDSSGKYSFGVVRGLLKLSRKGRRHLAQKYNLLVLRFYRSSSSFVSNSQGLNDTTTGTTVIGHSCSVSQPFCFFLSALQRCDLLVRLFIFCLHHFFFAW